MQRSEFLPWGAAEHRARHAGLGVGMSWFGWGLFSFLCFTFALHQVTSAAGERPIPGQLYPLDVDAPLPIQVQADCRGALTLGKNITLL